MRISDWSSDVCSSDLPLVHPVEHIGEQRLAALHMVGQIMVEMVAHRIFDQPRRLRTGQPVLRLALELRVADEDRQHDLRREIGRASCRERVCQYVYISVVAVSLKQQKTNNKITIHVP